jgi:hypothetical protein
MTYDRAVPGTGRPLRLLKVVRDLVTAELGHGWHAEKLGSGHIRVHLPNGATATIAGTPHGGRRSLGALRTDLRRATRRE